jgi:hypothetical protein
MVAALALSGCGLQQAFHGSENEHYYQARLSTALVAADLISLINTGKTIDDHIIGLATDEDCSTLRLSKGGPWCQPYPAPVAMIDVTEYCYKSLAKSTCYTVPIAADQPVFNGTYHTQVPAP